MSTEESTTKKFSVDITIPQSSMDLWYWIGLSIHDDISYFYQVGAKIHNQVWNFLYTLRTVNPIVWTNKVGPELNPGTKYRFQMRIRPLNDKVFYKLFEWHPSPDNYWEEIFSANLPTPGNSFDTDRAGVYLETLDGSPAPDFDVLFENTLVSGVATAWYGELSIGNVPPEISIYPDYWGWDVLVDSSLSP